jgi:hypothetical protein
VKHGEGTAALHRYYYNTITRHCVGFTYKGTRGNENNFVSAADCQAQCISEPFLLQF